jgi:protocatechuate 3,4-dioxygenase beta subunit
MLPRRQFLTTVAAAVAGATLSPELLAECRATSRATQGPYWRPDAPFTNDLRIQGGTPIVVAGTVRDARTCKPVANALLDVWQADHHGKYDLDYRKDQTFGRARIRAGNDGAFSFTTIRPAPYGMRPAHIHFIVSAEGRKSLVTQLYFEGDPHLDSDPQSSVFPDLITRVKNGRCAFDVFLT